MKVLNDMKIKTKILGSFIVVLILAAISSFLGIYKINQIDSLYSDILDNSLQDVDISVNMVDGFQSLRLQVRDLVIYADEPDKLQTVNADIESSYQSLAKTLQNYLDTSGKADTEMAELASILSQYHDMISQTNQYLSSGDKASAVTIVEGQGAELAKKLVNGFLSHYDDAKNDAHNNSVAYSAITRGSMWQSVFITLLILIVSLVLAIVVSQNITVPVKRLALTAKSIAEGDLSVNAASNSRDELGDLSNSMAVVVDTLNRLIYDINGVTVAMDKEGDLDARIDSGRFEGSYDIMARGINAVMEGFSGDLHGLLDCLAAYADGDFGQSLSKSHVGKKAVINAVMDQIRGNLTSFTDDIRHLVKTAETGQINERIDTTGYKNSWADMAVGLNGVLDGVVTPIAETIEVVGAMAEGRMSVRVRGDYKGEYARLKSAINGTLDSISRYIGEIAYVLNEMSDQNFDLGIQNEYLGDFGPIKDSLNRIIETLNKVLHEINISAEGVASGARSISDSSMTLAQGSSEQASSVEELFATIESITTQTHQNADTAKNVSELAIKAKDYAVMGNEEMKGMQKAMEDINKASSSISNIIKVIDDIALQTNLLALNAAVEAARAGQYGKGFAVVAEEVGTLAARSQAAAKETTVLIQGSIEKANNGTQIADQTANTLANIVSQVTEISNMIGGVADASLRQEEAITQINQGIGQIAQVTQSITATSEEGAASAEELSSQSELFKNMVNQFKIKKETSGGSGGAGMESGAMKKQLAITERRAEPERREPSVRAMAATINPASQVKKEVEKKKAEPVSDKVVRSTDVKKISEPSRTSMTTRASSAPARTVAAPTKTASVARSVSTAASQSAATKPALSRPTVKPAAPIRGTLAKPLTDKGKSSASPAKQTATNATPAHRSTPPISTGKKYAPAEGSGRAVYDRKDFGKY